MGTLRLALAVIVAGSHIQHVALQWGVGNVLAVKAFFVASGFYMALTLASGRYPTALSFYAARALRLFPLHLVILALMAVRLWLAPDGAWSDGAAWRDLLADPRRWPIAAGLMLVNVTMIGSDWTYHACLDAAAGRVVWLGWFGNCAPGGVPLQAFIVNGPMWTVGMEMVFYLVAPLVARRSLPVLMLVTAVAVAPHIWVTAIGEPARRDVVFFEFGYFMLGVLAYRLYIRLRGRVVDRAALGIVGGILLWATLDGSGGSYQLYILLLAAGTPYLFLASKDWRLDQRLGDLCYPVYVCQFLVLGVLTDIASHWSVDYTTGLWSLLNIVVLLGFAAVADRLVTHPIERVRHRLAAAVSGQQRARSIPQRVVYRTA